MGWKDKPQAELIFDYLLRSNFKVRKELRRDGIINLKIKDLEKFYTHILPFVKCKRKVNDSLMLMKGEFKKTKWHVGAIEHLRNYADTAAGISRLLGCSESYGQTILRQLLKMNLVQRRRKNVRRKKPTSIIKPFEYSLANKNIQLLGGIENA